MKEETRIKDGYAELPREAEARIYQGMLYLRQDAPEMENAETIRLDAQGTMKLLELLYERRYSLYMATTLALGSDDMPAWIASGNPDSTQDIGYTMQQLTAIQQQLTAIPDRTEAPEPSTDAYALLKWSHERSELDKRINRLQEKAQDLAMQFGLPDRIASTLKAIVNLAFQKHLGRKQGGLMDENAQSAAHWLSEQLQAAGYEVKSIDWQTDGLQARVAVNGFDVGNLRTCYNEHRKGTLIARLQEVLPGPGE